VLGQFWFGGEYPPPLAAKAAPIRKTEPATTANAVTATLDVPRFISSSPSPAQFL
jgi:hypothetical protein